MTRYSIGENFPSFEIYKSLQTKTLETLIPNYVQLSRYFPDQYLLNSFLTHLKTIFFSIAKNFIEIDKNVSNLKKEHAYKLMLFDNNIKKESKIINVILKKISAYDVELSKLKPEKETHSIKLELLNNSFNRVLKELDNCKQLESEINTLRAKKENNQLSAESVDHYKKTIARYQNHQELVHRGLVQMLYKIENEDHDYDDDRKETFKNFVSNNSNILPLGLGYARYILGQMIAIQAEDDSSFDTIDSRVKTFIKMANTINKNRNLTVINKEINAIDKDLNFYDRMRSILKINTSTTMDIDSSISETLTDKELPVITVPTMGNVENVSAQLSQMYGAGSSSTRTFPTGNGKNSKPYKIKRKRDSKDECPKIKKRSITKPLKK